MRLVVKDFSASLDNVSNPRRTSLIRRTSLKVCHYEALAMLKHNIQKIYVDKDWVVEQYMTLEKNKEWDALETCKDELVASLELELYAGYRGVPVDALQLSDIESKDEDSSEASVPYKKTQLTCLRVTILIRN
jgi:hypothetical protein